MLFIIEKNTLKCWLGPEDKQKADIWISSLYQKAFWNSVDVYVSRNRKSDGERDSGKFQTPDIDFCQWTPKTLSTLGRENLLRKGTGDALKEELLALKPPQA